MGKPSTIGLLADHQFPVLLGEVISNYRGMWDDFMIVYCSGFVIEMVFFFSLSFLMYL